MDKVKGHEMYAHITLEKGERSALLNLTTIYKINKLELPGPNILYTAVSLDGYIADTEGKITF